MRVLDYIVYNINTNKIVFTGHNHRQCEEYLQTREDKEEYKIGCYYKSI